MKRLFLALVMADPLLAADSAYVVHTPMFQSAHSAPNHTPFYQGGAVHGAVASRFSGLSYQQGRHPNVQPSQQHEKRKPIEKLRKEREIHKVDTQDKKRQKQEKQHLLDQRDGIQKLKSMIDQTRKQTEDFRKLIEDRNEEIGLLYSKMRDWETKYQAIYDQKIKSEESNNQWIKEKNYLNDQLESEVKAKKQLQLEKEQLEWENGQLIVKQRNELTDRDNQIHQLESSERSLLKQLTDETRDKLVLQGECDKHIVELEEVQSRFKIMSQESTDQWNHMHRQWIELQNQLGSAKKENLRLNNNNRQLEEALKEAQVETKGVRVELATAKNEIEKLTKDKQTLQNQCGDLQIEMDQTRNINILTLEESMERCNLMRTLWEKETSDLLDINGELDQKNRELMNNKTQLKDELDASQRRNQELSEEKDRLNNELTQTNDYYSGRVTRMQSEMDQLSEQKDETQHNLSRVSEEKETMDADLQREISQHGLTKDRLTECRRNANQTRDHLQNKQKNTESKLLAIEENLALTVSDKNTWRMVSLAVSSIGVLLLGLITLLVVKLRMAIRTLRAVT